MEEETARSTACGSHGSIRGSNKTISSKRMQAAIQTHTTASGTIIRVAAMLGLKRRAKHVDPLQAVRDAVARANAKAGR